MLDVAQYCFDKKHHHIVDNFPRILARCDEHTFISLRIADPYNNSHHLVRYIKDPELRASMRLRRSVQNVSLNNFYGKKRDTWDGLTDTFQGFVRGVNFHGDDIVQLRRRMVHFEELGLLASIIKMRDRVELLSQTVKEQFYGFNRCPVGSLAYFSKNQWISNEIPF